MTGPGIHMTAPRFLILGGGPAGLATAYYASRLGLRSRLLEKEASVGGLCRTVRHGNHRFDLGAHRFHDRDPKITADILQLLRGRMIRVDVPSRIYRWGRYIDFPLTPLSLMKSVSPGRGLGMAWDLFRARIRKRPVRTFKDYAINAFGKSVAETLLIDYSQKLWGLPAEQLSPEVATKRLSGMSLRSLTVELLSGPRKSEHLDGAFLYPKEGYGAIADSLARSLPDGTVRTSCPAVRIEHHAGRVTNVVHGAGSTAVGDCDTVVSSLPLSLLVRLLHPPPAAELLEEAARLRFRHVRLLYFRLRIPHFSGQATIYVSDPEICVTRITEPKNRSPRMAPETETGLAMEVPCFTGDSIDRLSESQLVDRVLAELGGAGFFDTSLVMDWQQVLLPHAYPVYDLEYRARVERLLSELSGLRNLHTTGRQGLFFYSHLHDQMRTARDLVQVLAAA